MARITIIVEDNAAYKDGTSYEGLDFSACNIPSDVWALQWYDTYGDIEKTNNINEDITELPAWATACLTKWQEADDARIAAEAAEAAEAAAEAAAAE